MWLNFFWLYQQNSSKKWLWAVGRKANLKGGLDSGLKVQLIVDKTKIICQVTASQTITWSSYTVYWLGKGDLGVWRKILKMIHQEQKCSKEHIVCVCLYFSSDFEEKRSVYIERVRCRVRWMILIFRNICFDREEREWFVLSPERSCDGVKLWRTVEEVDKVEQVWVSVNVLMNKLQSVNVWKLKGNEKSKCLYLSGRTIITLKGIWAHDMWIN